jgi:hypothetical protein
MARPTCSRPYAPNRGVNFVRDRRRDALAVDSMHRQAAGAAAADAYLVRDSLFEFSVAWVVPLRHVRLCFEHCSRSSLGEQLRQFGKNGGNALGLVTREQFGPILSSAVEIDSAAYRWLPSPLGAPKVQAPARATQRHTRLVGSGSPCQSKPLCSLAVCECRRPNIGNTVLGARGGEIPPRDSPITTGRLFWADRR